MVMTTGLIEFDLFSLSEGDLIRNKISINGKVTDTLTTTVALEQTPFTTMTLQNGIEFLAKHPLLY